MINYEILMMKSANEVTFSEREQAIRIAPAYKEACEKVHIDDEDIEYLHNTRTGYFSAIFIY